MQPRDSAVTERGVSFAWRSGCALTPVPHSRRPPPLFPLSLPRLPSVTALILGDCCPLCSCCSRRLSRRSAAQAKALLALQRRLEEEQRSSLALAAGLKASEARRQQVEAVCIRLSDQLTELQTEQAGWRVASDDAAEALQRLLVKAGRAEAAGGGAAAALLVD